ncbi:MAG: pyridoxamine 5'-phosphate oxidase family protein [Candidatus Kariarchaeaceae archaeon]|jgi:general stress protein 26
MTIQRKLPFTTVEKYIRQKDYGILGTIDDKGFPHSTSVLYGVSPPNEMFSLYVVTGKSYKKTINIRGCPNISFVIPFPHHIFRFVPSNCIQFQGTAEFLPIEDSSAAKAFQKNKILKMTLLDAMEDPEDYLFVKINPNQTIHGYGLGLSLRKLRDDHVNGSFKSKIPNERFNRQIAVHNY